MTTDTRRKIIEYIHAKNQARVHDLVSFLGLSHVAVHKQLKTLVANGELQKVGKPPLVFYKMASSVDVLSQPEHFPSDLEKIIINNFLSITPQGEFLYGMNGFISWAKVYQSNKSLLSLAQDYAKIMKEKENLCPDGWVNATEKILRTFSEPFVDHLLFADIYSYPLFGRTKLAKLVMHAKQSESKMLTDSVTAMVKPLVEKIIVEYQIDAVGFIPPTIPRKFQFMHEFSSQLNLALPHIDLVKVVPGEIPIAQKSLQKIEERVINASSSIYLRHIAEPSYANILLIDDVAGSGASFQETARKIKGINTGYKSIIAFAIVGNLKGYDVIRQI